MVNEVSPYGDIFLGILKRAVLASPFFALGYYILFRASDSGDGVVGAFDLSLFGFAGIILGAIIVAFPLARLAAEASGNLFWPGKHFDRRQPMYGAPRTKRARGDYEEAMAGFEQIASDYPGELQAYVEMIEIAIVNLKDADRANTIYQRGVAAMKSQESKEKLAGMYSAVRSRLRPKTGSG